MLSFIKSLKTNHNASLIESIIDGYKVIFESGDLSSKYANYDKHSDTATFAIGNTSQIASGVKNLLGDIGLIRKPKDVQKQKMRSNAVNNTQKKPLN